MKHVAALLLALTSLAVPAAASASPIPRGYDAVDQFRTPSSNIQCLMLRPADDRADNGVTCAVVSAQEANPSSAVPSSTWPYYTLLAHGRARVERSDNFPDAGLVPKMPYGATWAMSGGTVKVGPIPRLVNCTSRRSGLTCRNREGHGFTLSRTRRVVF